MARTKFPVEVLTPEGEVFNEEIEMLSTRTSVGSIGVLANHEPLLAMLEPTELRLYRSESEIVTFAQAEGYLQFGENRALVLVEEAIAPERLAVVVHPQSIVHGLISFLDGSTIAGMASPDMRTPIAQALAWPERVESGVQSLDLTQIGKLEFEPPDHVRFPSLGLARSAARAGGTAPAMLNAANEVAVQAFLDRRLNFTGIAAVIDKVLQRLDSSPVKALGDVLDADAAARRLAVALIEPSSGAFA